MWNFGNQSVFAFSYELIPSPDPTQNVYDKSHGTLRLWVAGQNLCEYSYANQSWEYQWNLLHLVEWLCDNLEHILGYDPFPLPIVGETTLELLVNSQVDIEDDVEEYLWYTARKSWMFRHSWFINRAGSPAPYVYFRRVDKNVEVAWKNDEWREQGLAFTYHEGSHLININTFRSTVFQFLYDIISKLQSSLSTTNDSEIVLRLKQRIDLLQPLEDHT